ncbi:MAG: hypothetical protein M3Y33_00560 [Actinomycetota bacterium]|nr:hypothetical protein [Actinomycetota bacterium]
MSIDLTVDIRFTLRPTNGSPAAVPGREAIAAELRDLLTPGGLEYVTLTVEGHQWVITGLDAIRSGGGV